jgi:hypothetical protein
LKIHIVYPGNGDEPGILSRLARALGDGTGYSMGQRPDHAADLNYYLPYLLYGGGYPEAMAAAWFTHREEGWYEKAAQWDKVAHRVDLRVTSTRLYHDMLAGSGPVAMATPPIDDQFFGPLAQHRYPGRVVGIAGYVYRSGRKGEQLIARLLKKPLGKDIELRAIGRGWPCRTEEISWASLPDFYRSIDVLLCTSLVEGPGYPPMEALACGTKVVVPREVGIFDEFPDIPGIVRYEKNNLDDMCNALREALHAVADPGELRRAVEGYTARRWVDDHKAAFEQLLHPVPPVERNLPDWRGNAGVYMVAYGNPARRCAEKAVASWHRHMPGVPVCVVSDEQPLGLGDGDVFVQQPDADLGARSVKTRIYDLAPQGWRYVLYVDADTEVVADVEFLFQALADGWEMLMCYNPARYILARHMIRPDNKDECTETFKVMGGDELIQFNGGVFGFRRCERTARFFRDWHGEWLRWGKRDQAAFSRTLYSNPLRLLTLGVEWNTITRYFPGERTAGILHYPTLARRYQGIINDRLDSPEAWRQAGLK